MSSTPNEQLAQSAGDDKVVIDIVTSKTGTYDDVAQSSATEKAGSLKQAPSTVSPFANTR